MIMQKIFDFKKAFETYQMAEDLKLDKNYHALCLKYVVEVLQTPERY